jgi:hypothetical protein
MSRKEWVRGLPWAFGVGRYDRKQLHWASDRSVGYDFLIGDSVRNHPNPNQTRSYYGGPDGFEHVLDLVEEASEGLLEDIRERHLNDRAR